MALTITHLERRFAPNVVRETLDVVGDGSAQTNAEIVASAAECIAEASALAHDILKNAWVDDSVRVTLIETDLTIRGAVLDIAMAIAGRRKVTTGGAGPGNPGNPFGSLEKRGTDFLREKTAATLRSRNEGVGAVPINPHASSGPIVQSIPDRPFIFGGVGGQSRNPGGF
jgi:hypothetical protein